jgi:L-lactate dehydrogenase complex protein LldG
MSLCTIITVATPIVGTGCVSPCVLLTSRSAGGRALSVLPPHHVVLARRDQLIADLQDAYALLRAKHSNDWPSFISLITGPSRTGDIERILVLGAHGPKRLTILCA